MSLLTSALQKSCILHLADSEIIHYHHNERCHSACRYKISSFRCHYSVHLGFSITGSGSILLEEYPTSSTVPIADTADLTTNITKSTGANTALSMFSSVIDYFTQPIQIDATNDAGTEHIFSAIFSSPKREGLEFSSPFKFML